MLVYLENSIINMNDYEFGFRFEKKNVLLNEDF